MPTTPKTPESRVSLAETPSLGRSGAAVPASQRANFTIDRSRYANFGKRHCEELSQNYAEALGKKWTGGESSGRLRIGAGT